MTLSLGPASSTGWGSASSATRLQLSTLTAVSARMARRTVLVGVHQLEKLDLVVFPSRVAVPALPNQWQPPSPRQPPTHPLLRAQPPPLSPQPPSGCLLNVLIIMMPPAVLLTTCHSVLGPCSVSNTVASLLSRIITTTATNLAKATGSLFCLPKDTLSDRKASSGRDRRVRARCARIQAGEALEPTPPAPPPARVHLTRTRL